MKFGLNVPRYCKIEFPGWDIDDLPEELKKQKLYLRDGRMDRLVVACDLNTVDGLRGAYLYAADKWADGGPMVAGYWGSQTIYLWHRIVVKAPWLARELKKEGHAPYQGKLPGYKISKKASLARIRLGWPNSAGWENYA